MPRFKAPTPDELKATEALQALYDSDGSPSRVYSEALRERIEVTWRKAAGLKPAKGAVCVQRLLGKRCGLALGKSCDCRPPGTDHPSLWLKDGKPFYYVSQPYGLEMGTLKEMTRFCDDAGLTFTVDSKPAFHFPGRVLFVTFQRAK